MRCPRCGRDNSAEVQFCGRCGTPLGMPVAMDAQVDSAQLPMVEFIPAIRLAFRNYFKFSGRSRRSEYWWFFLLTQVLSIIGNIPIVGWIIGIIGGLAVIIPGISITTRRLHDIGRSGWWQLGYWVVTIVVWIVLIGAFAAGFAVLENERYWFAGLLFLLSTAASIGAIALIAVWVIWLVRKGDLGPNKYGPDPRQRTSQQPYKS